VSRKKIPEDLAIVWRDIILKLRLLTFAGFSSDPGVGHTPHDVRLSPAAEARFDEEYDRLETLCLEQGDGETIADMFYSKAEGGTGRIALQLHAQEYACGLHGMLDPVSEQTMLKAIEIARWLVASQLRCYSLAGRKYAEKQVEDALTLLKRLANDEGVGTVREVMRHGTPKRDAYQTRAMIEPLVEQGLVAWINETRKAYRIVTNTTTQEKE
jgi:hypothetical protein